MMLSVARLIRNSTSNMLPMTTNVRLRIKTGGHEFEAESPIEAIQSHVTTFLRIIGREEKPAEEPALSPASNLPSSADLEEFLRIENNIVSMSTTSGALDRYILVLLLGQEQLRGNAAVAGTEIMAGLRGSWYTINRADHILKRFASTGDIVATGKRRRRRYRLTTDGAGKALKIAWTLDTSEPKENPTRNG
jgi:hypothetical protein